MKFSSDILAVIVLYHKKLDVAATFKTLGASLKLAGEKADLFVYDNSPDDTENDKLTENAIWNIIYQPDTSNGGVSKAYNMAASIAKKSGKKWLLLLDQDTEFPANTVSAYENAIDRYPDEKLFAPIMLTSQNEVISPAHFRFMRGFYAKNAAIGLRELKGYSLINCGMCINVEAFYKNNGYNERIKLDFSDHDFIRRFKKNVTPRFIALDLNVRHGLSTSEKNSYDADRIRFKYYLEGAKYFSASPGERILLIIHVLVRSIKLSMVHKNWYFIKAALKHIFD